MPGEIRAAVEWAEADDGGARHRRRGRGPRVLRRLRPGRARRGRLGAGGPVDNPLQQERRPWDSMVDYAVMKRHTEDFMALWRSAKPTIAKVHGYAVAGGSDIALCCDLLVMADDAKIGYMPTRVWGCPTTAMWTFRLGAARAKQLMFTGDTHHRRAGRRVGPGQRRRAAGRARCRVRRSSPTASPACRARTWRCTSSSSTR